MNPTQKKNEKKAKIKQKKQKDKKKGQPKPGLSMGQTQARPARIWGSAPITIAGLNRSLSPT